MTKLNTTYFIRYYNTNTLQVETSLFHSLETAQNEVEYLNGPDGIGIDVRIYVELNALSDAYNEGYADAKAEFDK